MGKKVRRHEAHRLFHRMSEHGAEGQFNFSSGIKMADPAGFEAPPDLRLLNDGPHPINNLRLR